MSNHENEKFREAMHEAEADLAEEYETAEEHEAEKEYEEDERNSHLHKI